LLCTADIGSDGLDVLYRIFASSYQLVVTIILLNLLIAIINDSFERVHMNETAESLRCAAAGARARTRLRWARGALCSPRHMQVAAQRTLISTTVAWPSSHAHPGGGRRPEPLPNPHCLHTHTHTHPFTRRNKVTLIVEAEAVLPVSLVNVILSKVAGRDLYTIEVSRDEAVGGWLAGSGRRSDSRSHKHEGTQRTAGSTSYCRGQRTHDENYSVQQACAAGIAKHLLRVLHVRVPSRSCVACI
jgi:hypothetical protein